MKDLKEVLLATHAAFTEDDYDAGLLPSSFRTVVVDPALQLPVAYIRTQEDAPTVVHPAIRIEFLVVHNDHTAKGVGMALLKVRCICV